MKALKAVGLVAVLGALFAAACSDASSTSPTAPSAGAVMSGGGTSLVSQGNGNGNSNGNGNGNGNNGNNGNDGNNGNGQGNGNGGGQGNGRGNDPAPPATPPATPAPTTPTPTNPAPAKAEIEGLIESLAGLSLNVNGQAILVPPTAVIRHGSHAILFAELQVGDRVHVKASRLVDGSLEATEVNVQNPTGNPNDPDLNADGSATVRVAVLDANASEAGADTGAFRLTRVPTASLPVSSPLTVSFTLTGTATNGTDYQLLPQTATFLAGQATVDVVVTPLPDALAEGSETVILTLTNAAPYALGTPITATVTITELPVVTVTAFDSSASETGNDTGTFRFTRTGSTAATLTVFFTLTGTAGNNIDYVAIALNNTFLAGQATTDLIIIPKVDTLIEGTETVILTLTDGAVYDLGTPSTATITISD